MGPAATVGRLDKNFSITGLLQINRVWKKLLQVTNYYIWVINTTVRKKNIHKEKNETFKEVLIVGNNHRYPHFL